MSASKVLRTVGGNPRSSSLKSERERSRMRIATTSPKMVGKEERRRSRLCPFASKSKRLSYGLLRPGPSLVMPARTFLPMLDERRPPRKAALWWRERRDLG